MTSGKSFNAPCAWLKFLAFRRGASGVPGMHVDLRGESPLTNLMEVKVSEAQGRSREAGSEGSV